MTITHFQSLHPLPKCNWHPSSCCPGSTSQSGWVCICSRTMGPFKWTLLRDWQFLPLLKPPLGFTARSYQALFFWHWNPGLCGLVWGWDSLLPRCSSWFLSTTREYGTACSFCCQSHCYCLIATTPHCLCPGFPSLPLLPIWMNISSLNP